VLVESRPFGGAYLLDGLWRRLGLDRLITGAPQKNGPGRPRDLAATERVLFALVANRALAPSSKLAATGWMNERVHLAGFASAVGVVEEEACYRAMDWLAEREATFAQQVYSQVTDLLNLEVDILFFDTTSTYFETEVPDEAIWRDQAGRRVTVDDEPGSGSDSDGAGGHQGDQDPAATPPPGGVKEAGFRTYGKSKDSRDDLPQVVIGMAVTRDGIPVRTWCWPGNTSDSALIRQVHADMRAWSLSRVIYAADRGFTSAENRRDLMTGADGYILGEKLRSNSPEATAALSRQGRYRVIAENMQVKEVDLRSVTGSPERFIICYNPDEARRDEAKRAQMVARLEAMIVGTDTKTDLERGKLAGQISTMPGLNRFLRTTPGGLLRLDRRKIAAEANLDGKYLLRTSDAKMSAEDVALGYKQLLQVERAWRDMKSTLDLRPVFHRLEDRIRAHVTLCWLALLLIRITENATNQSWRTVHHEMDRRHIGTFTTPAGSYKQLTEPTATQTAILKALRLEAPKTVQDITTTTP
jgi:hypothetical protein